MKLCSENCHLETRYANSRKDMKFGISYDANIESGLIEVLNEISLEEHFEERFFDDSGLELFIVLMCRDPIWKFKQRIRFDRKENCLYMDLMLDLPTMSNADFPNRKRIVAVTVYLFLNRGKTSTQKESGENYCAAVPKGE